MTQVRLALSAPTSDGTGRRPTGSLEWRPTKRRNVTGDVVLPAPFTVSVGATTPPVVTVAPTEVGWAWAVVERVQGGSPHKRLLVVPDSVSVIDYVDLVEVDPATLVPVTTSNAWYAQVQADFEAKVPRSGAATGQVPILQSNGTLAFGPVVGADATASSKGIVRLAGDLGGTAAAPTVPALAGILARLDALEALMATKAGLVDGSLDPAQMPVLSALSLRDDVSQLTSQLTYNSTLDRFVKVNPA